MRKLVFFAVAGLVLASAACGPKKVPAPTVTSPKFPDFIRPVVPDAMQSSLAAQNFDRGWQYLQAGDLKAAEREFSLALKSSPSFYPADAALGYVNLARKDQKTALTHFDRALGRQPAEPSALVGRGEALLALDRQAEAVDAFEAAVAADGSLVDLRRRVDVLKFRLAQTEVASARAALQAGRLDDAIATYQVAIQHSPESAFLYRELAVAERQKGDVDDALQHFRHAAAIEPGDAASLAQIGELLEARDDVQGATDAYAASLAIEANEDVAGRLAAIRRRAAIERLPAEYRAIDSAPQLTRADLAALLGVRLAPALQGGRAAGAVLITDVRNNWAESWIMDVARAGVMEPFANHAFQPKTIVRRADLAQALARVMTRVAPPSSVKTWQSARPKITDVPPTHLAYPAAALVISSGVMSSGADGAFQPNRAISGAEAIAAIERVQRLANLRAQGDAR